MKKLALMVILAINVVFGDCYYTLKNYQQAMDYYANCNGCQEGWRRVVKAKARLESCLINGRDSTY